MVKNVDHKLIEAFAPLIPGEYIAKLESGQSFCLGALKEDGDAKLPVGVLVFSVEKGEINGTETENLIVLQWFYVSEEHRQEGYMNELMDALSDVLDGSPAEGIICDIPLDSEYDLAEAVLISWGFRFEAVSTYEMIISKEDCRRQARSKDITIETNIVAGVEKPKGMVSILDIPESVFKKAVKTARENNKSEALVQISESREDYAGDLSCVIKYGDDISSMVLVERYGDGDLHLVRLLSFVPDRPKELLALLRYLVSYYYMNYPEETKIHVTLKTDRAVNLAKHILPDMDTIKVRRGFFS